MTNVRTYETTEGSVQKRGVPLLRSERAWYLMRVASVQDDTVMFLDNSDYLNKVGRRVLITEGYFAGVEGVVKRINKNKHVVVQLEGLAAVAVTYVPASCLRELDA